jgi:hypothetical protein
MGGIQTRKDLSIMALVLTGIVNGMRPVGGVIEEGKRKGEEWRFLSLEITDPRYGKVYSCQLRDDDTQFAAFVEGKNLKSNLTGHKVKVTVKGMTASEREIVDKGTGDARLVMQIRSQITNIRDLGLPEDDE